MHKIIFILTLLITKLVYADIQNKNFTIHTSIADFLQRNNIPSSSLSFSIKYLNSKDNFEMNFNENIQRNPASTMKLVNSMLAFSVLGNFYTWKTDFFADNPLNKNFAGNIFIKMQADPKLIPQTMLPMLLEWKKKGVESLEANFIIDNSILNKYPDSSSHYENDKVYAVNPSANNFAFNTILINFQQEYISNNYPIYNFAILNTLKTYSMPCPNNKDWSKDINHTWIYNEGKYFLNLYGSYSKECKDKVLNVVSIIPNNEFFVWSLLGLWQSIGGTIKGKPKIIEDNELNKKKNYIEIGSIYSYPLQNLLVDVNKFSNNLMARLIFLRLGIIKQNFDLNAKLSIEIANEYLAKYGIKTTNIIFENGSGLSNIERTTTKEMINILEVISKQKYFAPFLLTLPVVGVDGTMKNRLTDMAGKAFIKTGTLNNVKAIAGYINDKQGGYIAISAIINHEHITGANQILDELIRYVFNMNLEIPEKIIN